MKMSSYQRLKNENIFMRAKIGELHTAIRNLKKAIGINNSVIGETILMGNEEEIVKPALTLGEIKHRIKELPDL